ncbi:hypothetical protein LAZ67_7001710 [Cordylochernes scorpioides]|uniref:Uncharacterized protein n=1 Tax=Cordylochernes scorpioides TaxID=51811 RepID=A0ABY6KN14_9ARAC|nr:hypothetical protein LAZ67_7001710 [Cordylochernes scorpioides]
MASVFWSTEGILLIDYLGKGITISGEYYYNFPDQLDVKIREKRPGLKKKNHPLSGKGTAHKSLSAIGKLRDLRKLENTPMVESGSNTQGVQLHGFGDASEDAYAAVIYIKLHMDDIVSRLAPGFHRRVKAKTSFQDDDVPIDYDTTTKPLFTPQEKVLGTTFQDFDGFHRSCHCSCLK